MECVKIITEDYIIFFEGSVLKTDRSLSEIIIQLKQEYTKCYRAQSFISEVIPLSSSDNLPFEDSILRKLNDFIKYNPIYYQSDNLYLLDTPCKSYQGDINTFWLSSKKYDTSYQPFYPTWMLSAYALSLTAKQLGFREIIDIGSGDGRIPYCGKLLNMDCLGIEIDEDLARLQNNICDLSQVTYPVFNENVLSFEFDSFNFISPVFFISGLPEMGEMLATSVITKIKKIARLKHTAGFNFMGSHVMKQYSSDKTNWGWGNIIKQFDLRIVECLTLPTHWTNDQKIDTPYIYTKFK
jgi:hypothetical protein